MSWVTRSASSSWPCRNSQRGLSGTLRRTSRIAKPIAAARPKHRRQPMSAAKMDLWSRMSDASEPRIVPIQYDPPITRSTHPRTRAGISSSTAEWIAEYSPPTPAPVITRQAMNQAKLIENAVSTLPARKMQSVSMNSRLRPIRSAKRPKYRAPRQAPRMYAEPAAPTCDAVSSRPAPFSVSRPPIAPTIVTASPSRIQTVPRPVMIIQCQRDQGSRSRRAGIWVSIVRSSCPAAVAIYVLPHHLATRGESPVYRGGGTRCSARYARGGDSRLTRAAGCAAAPAKKRAGLLAHHKEGRGHCRLVPEAMMPVGEWVARYGVFWQRGRNGLAAHFSGEATDESHARRPDDQLDLEGARFTRLDVQRHPLRDFATSASWRAC